MHEKNRVDRVVVTEDREVSHESVFRVHWRDRPSAAARPGELIKQPGWIDAALVALGVLLVGGTVAAGTVTVARSAALPAVVQGTSVTADRTGAAAPERGAEVQYRDASGTKISAVVVDVTASEVTAQLQRTSPSSAGELLVPAGRQRVINVLLPRLW